MILHRVILEPNGSLLIGSLTGPYLSSAQIVCRLTGQFPRQAIKLLVDCSQGIIIAVLTTSGLSRSNYA